MSGYEFVLVLHVLFAVFVVGPLGVAVMTSPRLVRTAREDALRTMLRITEIYVAASLVVVLLGVWLVGLTDAYSLGDFWVSATFALWIVAVALTVGLVIPAQRTAAKALAKGPDEAEAAKDQVGKLSAGAGLSMLAWVAIIVLMVTTPGS